MMKKLWFVLLIFTAQGQICSAKDTNGTIDRHALVTRHNINLTNAVDRPVLQVGNGEIAFGVDATGLQTFYGNTLAQWGWHKSPLPAGSRAEDFELQMWDVHGRKVGYPTSGSGQKELYSWLRENPHRLNLGKFGLKVVKTEGGALVAGDLDNFQQELDLWRGIIKSRYQIEGQPVEVITCAHPTRDAVAVRIESPLLAAGCMGVSFLFPYGNATSRDGADWSNPSAHQTIMTRPANNRTIFARRLDADGYYVMLNFSGDATLQEIEPHIFELMPSSGKDVLEFVYEFSPAEAFSMPLDFGSVRQASLEHWPTFWNQGGAIDLSQSKDSRWKELERRIVLSQYLLAVNEAGSLPPQESGLLCNSGWYGKFHLEMHWWHGTHYALWDRWPLFERSLGWYQKILPVAREVAQIQGYQGARWPKMVGPEGRDSPSGIGPLLIWQQPHPIFYAELDYRLHPDEKTLAKWKNIVLESADFMASYAWRNPQGKYDLGPPLRIAAEHTPSAVSRNPAFELSYWRFGLKAAQMWRERLGLSRSETWDEVLKNLAPLPIQDGVYVLYDGIPDMWTKYNRSHTDVIGAAAFLPGDGVDWHVMDKTFEKTISHWQLDSTWGWDFPWLAMAAARLGKSDQTIDVLLMEVGKKNDYDVTGVCRGGPADVYFPGNGGLLYAVAMMAAGWDGCPDRNAPGFPDNGQWDVKWEGLRKAP